MRHVIFCIAAASLVGMIWQAPATTDHQQSAQKAELSPQLPPLAVCFAEGTDAGYMAEWTHRLLDREGALDFNLGGRWQNTANGSTGSQGTGVTLTYSFVPDGVLIQGQASRLYTRMNQLFGNQQVWQDLFAQVFAGWSDVTGNIYMQVADDGAAFGNSSPGVIGARGDVRIAMVPIDGQSGVLAYNYFPDRGDMVLDSDENWASGTNNYRFFRNIVAHEHGHGLGIEHVCPINTTKLMEPTYTSAFDGPQHDDILAGQRGYGDPYEPNDTQSSAHSLGLIDGTRVLELASLDDDADTDWWEFSIVNGRSLTVTLAPDGYDYLEGEQNNDGSCEAGTPYSTHSNQNLNLTLTDSNGSPLVVSNSQPPGGTEEIFRYDVPQGQTNLKVLVNGATNNTIQLYRLTIESVDPATPYLSGCPLRIDSTQVGEPVAGAVVLTNPPQAGQLAVSSITVSGPFSVSPVGPTSLAPNSDLPITVTFNGETEGFHSGELVINHNGPGGVLTCEVSAFAITSSLILFTGSSTNFGDVPIATVDSTLIGLRTVGNVPLVINSVSTQSPFSINFSGPAVLQPGPLLRLYPRVSPTELGEVRGWLIIHHSAASSPDSVELIANGTPNLSLDESSLLPTEFMLHQNYPNPFNAVTQIAFDLPQHAAVSLKLYNIQGQLVRELIGNRGYNAGRHVLSLKAGDLATGLYVYRLEAASFKAERKLLLLR